MVVPVDLIELGKIATAHGVRGLVKVQTYSDRSEALQATPVWWLQAPALDPKPDTGAWLKIKIKSCASHGNGILLAGIDGIGDRDAAMALRGHSIWVSRADFPAPTTDEYYWVDLIGCRVFGVSADTDILLGKVDDVVDNGAHAILHVALGEFDEQQNFTARLDHKNRPAHTMIPFVAAHVAKVDLQSGIIHTNWPEEF